MWIAVSVGATVVDPMDRRPHQGRPLAGKDSAQSREESHRRRQAKRTVRQAAVISQADPDAARQPVKTRRDSHGLPGQEERCGKQSSVHRHHPRKDNPIQIPPAKVAGAEDVEHGRVRLAVTIRRIR